MYRKMFALLGLLFALSLAACSGGAVPEPVVESPTDTPSEPAEPAEPTEAQPDAEDDVETVGEPQTADLPQLPRLQTNNGQGGGIGMEAGGGGLAQDAIAGGGPAATSMMRPMNIFSGTVFTLNTQLPGEPTTAAVWRQPEQMLDLETARAIAERMNFSSPLYQEMIPAEFRGDMEMIAEGVWRQPFYLFDGRRQLFISGFNTFYEDLTATLDGPSTLTFEQTRPLVDAQIAEWGGFDFDYLLVEDGPGSVSVRRVINGRPLNQPEAFFTYNNDGQLVYASYNVMSDMVALGDYPLISAEEAWALIQDGVMKNGITFRYEPTFERVVEPMPENELYQYWQPVQEPGDSIRVYGYPQVFMPVQDDSLPRVRLNQYQLEMAPDAARELAMSIPGEMIAVGTLGEDGRSLTVSEWQMVESTPHMMLLGTIMRTADGVQLQTEEGDVYNLPNVPADVSDGERVNVFGRETTIDEGQTVPTLYWTGMERHVRPGDGDTAVAEPLPAPGFAEGEPMPGFASEESVTIESVSLEYFSQPVWPEMVGGDAVAERPSYDFPAVIVQPVWAFSGVTGDGEAVNFHVPAVGDEYLK